MSARPARLYLLPIVEVVVVYVVIAAPLVGLGVSPLSACSAGVLAALALAVGLGVLHLGIGVLVLATGAGNVAEDRVREIIHEEKEPK